MYLTAQAGRELELVLLLKIITQWRDLYIKLAMAEIRR